MRFAVLAVLILGGCGGSVGTKEPPPTKMEEIVGSWSGDNLSLTIKEDGSGSSLYTVKQPNGKMTDLMFSPKVQQEGQGYTVPILLNQNKADQFVIEVSDGGKSMTLIQKEGPKKLKLSKDA